MFDLLGLVIAFGGGLVVGWHFLPQPAWIAKFFGPAK